MESGIQENRPFGIRNSLRWNLEFVTRDPVSTSWNPNFETVTDYMGRLYLSGVVIVYCFIAFFLSLKCKLKTL